MKTLILSAMVLTGVVYGSYAMFSAPKPIEPANDVPNTFEVHKLQSRWYWVESKIKEVEHKDRTNYIGKSLYRELQTEIETELVALNVCKVGKEWVRCGKP